MNNQLVQLAKERGFVSYIVSDKEWKYSTLEEDRYLIWMTLLQKWLREKHNIHIQITTDDGIEYGMCLNIIGNPEESGYWRYLFKSYGKALEEGLKESFLLL